MAPKRKRNNQSAAVAKAKRAKFVLDVFDESEPKLEGEVLVTGSGDTGQLGLGPDVMEKLRPTLVELPDKIVNICAGGMHTVCLTDEGKVLTFGCNDEGALGRVTENKEGSEYTAGEVELPGKVIQISAGDSHTAALLKDGRVFAWGTFRDSHGNLGMSNPEVNERLPYEIIKDVEVVKIASGADHLVFLSKQGEVYTCGCAEQGQLGRTSFRTSGRHARSGIGKEQIGNLLLPTKIKLKPSLKLHFENIWAGTYSTFAKVAGSSNVYVFGLNNYNQLGIDNLEPHYLPTLSKEFSKFPLIMIASGQHHSLALDHEGRVFALGRKEYGRLGLGKDCADATELQEIPLLRDKKVVSIATGSATSFAVTTEGELYGWGMGTGGQLGTGEEEDCFEPTLIKSKQLVDRKVFLVSSGGQHSVILAQTKNNNTNHIEN